MTKTYCYLGEYLTLPELALRAETKSIDIMDGKKIRGVRTTRILYHINMPPRYDDTLLATVTPCFAVTPSEWKSLKQLPDTTSTWAKVELLKQRVSAKVKKLSMRQGIEFNEWCRSVWPRGTMTNDPEFVLSSLQKKLDFLTETCRV